ncbi:MAG: RdgB/HAM1 family non-canonical purine NTP pyrophosphatase [SAR202 cluster bacterium]|nr:RdgB/HAM1 family non-canonical purine NTP pyrophosphatase [SAR202 cluster bacterium]
MALGWGWPRATWRNWPSTESSEVYTPRSVVESVLSSKADKSRLLIATRNRGKMREFRQLLLGVPIRLVSLDEVGVSLEVEETGGTFEENARIKAIAYAQAAGGRLLALADDSGLEVDALGGAPGIHSARYGGDASFSDQDRVALLLRNLEGVPWERRTARFRSVIAVWAPGGSITTVVGSVAGMIQYEPAGTGGFGYDPVFFLPSYGATMAQLDLLEKNRISHRADAARKAVTVLQRLLTPDP